MGSSGAPMLPQPPVFSSFLRAALRQESGLSPHYPREGVTPDQAVVCSHRRGSVQNTATRHSACLSSTHSLLTVGQTPTASFSSRYTVKPMNLKSTGLWLFTCGYVHVTPSTSRQRPPSQHPTRWSPATVNFLFKGGLSSPHQPRCCEPGVVVQSLPGGSLRSAVVVLNHGQFVP